MRGPGVWLGSGGGDGSGGGGESTGGGGGGVRAGVGRGLGAAGPACPNTPAGATTRIPRIRTAAQDSALRRTDWSLHRVQRPGTGSGFRVAAHHANRVQASELSP